MELFWKLSNIVIARRFNSIENADRILVSEVMDDTTTGRGMENAKL
jgi:ABC-type multidrug transport system fused ATPase/permease subunit